MCTWVIDMFYIEARSGLVPVDEFFFTRGSNSDSGDEELEK